MPIVSAQDLLVGLRQLAQQLPVARLGRVADVARLGAADGRCLLGGHAEIQSHDFLAEVAVPEILEVPDVGGRLPVGVGKHTHALVSAPFAVLLVTSTMPRWALQDREAPTAAVYLNQ